MVSWASRAESMKGEKRLYSRKILELMNTLTLIISLGRMRESGGAALKFLANTILDYNLLRGERLGRISFAAKPRNRL